MNNDTMMSPASVEYTRGLREGKLLGHQHGLQDAITLLHLIELQPDGTYTAIDTAIDTVYTDPLQAVTDIIQQAIDHT
jgi:hypothetical protein